MFEVDAHAQKHSVNKMELPHVKWIPLKPGVTVKCSKALAIKFPYNFLLGWNDDFAHTS